MEAMMKNILSILFLLSFASAVETGTITGTVVDGRTKEPLAGVNVYLHSTSLGAATDLEGSYRIENVPLGTYHLHLSYIGYTSYTATDVIVFPSKPTRINIEITEQALESKQIDVTAGYFVEETVTQPSIVGLSREEIRRYPGGFEDVVRTVSTLPGVAVNVAGGRNDLLVRGGGPSENLFTINNIEIPNINHFGTQGTSSGSLSLVNLDFVEKVTFSTGGFGVSYGDKMSSVLTLDMVRGREDKFGTKVLISATQFGINVEGPLTEKGDFVFSARESYLDLIFKAAGLPFVPVYTDFNFIFNYDLSPNDKLFLLGLSAIDRIDRDNSTDENRVKNSVIMDNTQKQFISGINYRRLVEDGYYDFTVNYNYYDFAFSQSDPNQIEFFTSSAREKELGFKSQRYLALGRTNGFKIGLSAKFLSNQNNTVFADTIYDRSGNRVTSQSLGLSRLEPGKESAGKYASFFEWDWIANSKMQINSGVRLDYFAFLKHPLYVSPRLQFRYRLTDFLSVKSSYGIYYQSPSYVWLAEKENRNLRALKNTMTIIGLDYLLREDTRLTLETFYKNYQDLPTGTKSGINDYLVITNTGVGYGGSQEDFQSFGFFPMVSRAYGRTYGLELSMQKKYSEIPAYGQVSFAYAQSKYTAGNSKQYPGIYDQRIIFNLSGGYKINANWEISGKYRYFTGVPYTPVYSPDSNPINPGTVQNLPEEYLNSRLPDQNFVDLRIDRYFSFNNWRLVVYLDIQNVLNQPIKTMPRFDFWNNQVVSEGNIGILPSIGISAEF
jgi:outer membrane receptor for ferrienterochelin and colicin